MVRTLLAQGAALVQRMVEIARQLKPQFEVLVRSHNAQEAELSRSKGDGQDLAGEDEPGRAMVRHVLERFAPGWRADRACAGA